MPHIQIQADTSMPFIPQSNYHFWEMLVFSVTEGVTVTFRWEGDGAPRVWIFVAAWYDTARFTEQWGYPQD